VALPTWNFKVGQSFGEPQVVAGDLVFFGEGNGKFRTVDARTGANLFVFDAAGQHSKCWGAAAGPIAYLADGREFIVNAFGGNVPDRTITSDGNCLGGRRTPSCLHLSQPRLFLRVFSMCYQFMMMVCAVL